MPLRYHRSTPSEFGDWPYSGTGKMSPTLGSSGSSSPSPSIVTKELPDLPKDSLESSPAPDMATKQVTPQASSASLATMPSPQSSLEDSRSPRHSLRSLVLVDNNLPHPRDESRSPRHSLRSLVLIERRSSVMYASSPSPPNNLAAPSFNASRRSSLSYNTHSSGRDSVNFRNIDTATASRDLFRLSALDMLRRDIFLEVDQNYNSSYPSPAQRTVHSMVTATSATDENPRTPAFGPSGFPVPSINYSTSSLKNFLETNSDEDEKALLESQSNKSSKLFKALRRLRRTNKADAGAKSPKPTSPPCPPTSFLDMDDDEDDKAKARSTFSRFNPFSSSQTSDFVLRKSPTSTFGARRRTLSQSGSLTFSSSSPRTARIDLTRSVSKPIIGVTTSQSSLTLRAVNRWRSVSPESKKQESDIVPPLPKSWTERQSAPKKGKGKATSKGKGKGKIDVSKIKVELSSGSSSPSATSSVAPDNALGLYNGYEEARALGEYINTHIFPPTHSGSPKTLSSSQSSPLQGHSIQFPGTSESGSPSLSALGDRPLTRAELYAKYSPPPQFLPQRSTRSRLPSRSSSTAGVVYLKEVRSSSIGSGHSDIPEASSAIICGADDAKSLIDEVGTARSDEKRPQEAKRAEAKVVASTTTPKLTRSRVNMRRSRNHGPPPFPPPTCPLPPLPTYASAALA